MSLSAIAIVSLANTKTRLNESSPTNDSIIERMIEDFTQLIEVEVGRPVRKRTVTDKRCDGTGERTIFLPWTPVATVTQIQLRDDDDDSVLATLTSATDWILKDLDTGEIKLVGYEFPVGRNNILFSGAVGFDTTDIRYRNFEEAAYLAVDDYYRRWQRRELGVVQKSYPDGSASFIPPAALPPTVRQKLSPYIRAMGI